MTGKTETPEMATLRRFKGDESDLRMIERLREAVSDGVATLCAVRATADTDDWEQSGPHFARICLESIQRMNHALRGKNDRSQDAEVERLREALGAIEQAVTEHGSIIIEPMGEGLGWAATDTDAEDRVWRALRAAHDNLGEE